MQQKLVKFIYVRNRRARSLEQRPIEQVRCMLVLLGPILTDTDTQSANDPSSSSCSFFCLSRCFFADLARHVIYFPFSQSLLVSHKRRWHGSSGGGLTTTSCELMGRALFLHECCCLYVTTYVGGSMLSVCCTCLVAGQPWSSL